MSKDTTHEELNTVYIWAYMEGFEAGARTMLNTLRDMGEIDFEYKYDNNNAPYEQIRIGVNVTIPDDE